MSEGRVPAAAATADTVRGVMVRGGSSRALAAAALTAAVMLGCSGGDDGGVGDDGGGEEPAGSTSAPPTVPTDADAGLAYLVLGGELHLLQVRSCALEPVVDPATGITTEVAIDADAGADLAVSVTRQSFTAAVLTVTDRIQVASADGTVLESSRAETGGRFHDVRAPGALAPLFSVEGDLVTGAGVFGPPGSTDGDPGLEEGSLTLRCPPAG